jgi:hypothetical protein
LAAAALAACQAHQYVNEISHKSVAMYIFRQWYLAAAMQCISHQYNNAINN